MKQKLIKQEDGKTILMARWNNQKKKIKVAN